MLPAKKAASGNGGNWAFHVQNFINNNFQRGTSPLYLVTYGLLIIGFAYFYTPSSSTRTSRPTRSASRAGSSPASGPGPRPSATSGRSSTASPCPGALFIAVGRPAAGLSCSARPCPAPQPAQLGFFGISILIAVGVALETMKQIDSQLMMRNYEGFLK